MVFRRGSLKRCWRKKYQGSGRHVERLVCLRHQRLLLSWSENDTTFASSRPPLKTPTKAEIAVLEQSSILTCLILPNSIFICRATVVCWARVVQHIIVFCSMKTDCRPMGCNNCRSHSATSMRDQHDQSRFRRLSTTPISFVHVQKITTHRSRSNLMTLMVTVRSSKLSKTLRPTLSLYTVRLH